MATDLLKNFSVKETAKISLKIDNFKNYIYANSPDFYSSKNKYRFKLYIHPKIKIFNVDQVFISLHTNANEYKSLFQYRVSILDADDQKKYSEEYIENYYVSNNNVHNNENFTYENFILFDDCSEYLINNDLKISCEVDILEAKSPTETINKLISVQTNLQKNYQALLESSEFSDIVLSVKEKKFKAHKNILAAQSSVFRAMFSNDLEEKKQNRVEITDVEVDVFEHLLSFIYAGKVPETNENSLELFIAADKYHLDDLKYASEHLLSQSLTTESVVKVLVIADMHSASELKSKCLDYITVNSVAVKVTEAWKQLKSRPDLLMELYDNISAKAHPFLKS